jgi:hypothetical protein
MVVLVFISSEIRFHLGQVDLMPELNMKSVEADFLGYKVSAEGSRPLEERVAHLQDCPPPKTIGQLRRFLGMLNFYI